MDQDQMDYSMIFDYQLNFQPFPPQDQSNPAFSTINSQNIVNSFKIDQMEEIKRPSKHQKPSSSSSSNFSQILSFEKSNSSPAISQKYYGDDDDLDYSMTYNKGVGRVYSRGPIEAKEHVIAERKRRAKISQLYIALSVVVPDLKKADKGSILVGATKHVKQLQERLKILEEQVVMKSAICVKKTKIRYTNEESSDNRNSDCQAEHSSLPEIEARVSESDVLIRIHCEKRKSSTFLLSIILDEVQKLNLCVVSSNVMPFGCATLYITVVAQMEDKFASVTAKDLVKSLRLALQRLA